jgi:hypothetical protein
MPQSSPQGPRPAEQRKADALAKLAVEGGDVWVATASPDGQAHLVPLSLCWDDGRVVLATERRSRTVANIERTGRARLALGPERDVVVLDVALVTVVDVERAPQPLAEAYAAQADWEPRDAGAGYVYVVLAPERIQVWREADEIVGRTLMRGGHWLV